MVAVESGCDAVLLGKLHRAVLPISCLMIGFCYLDRSNVAYMQLQLQHPRPAGLGFSDSLYGNASGLFFVGYSAFQIPSNLILAKVGAPRWLTFIVCLWGACAALMACMRNGTEFVMLRLALGVFEAGTFPGIWYHMTLFYPKTDLTLPLAATKAAIMVAQLMSAPIAAILIALDGTLGLRGWQWLALVEGGATVVVGASLLWWLPPRPEAIKSLDDKQLTYIAANVTRPMTSSDVLEGLRTAAATRALWRLAAVFALKSCAAYCLIFWTPLVISDILGPSGSPLHAVLLTAVPYAFAASTAMGVGWLSHSVSLAIPALSALGTDVTVSWCFFPGLFAASCYLFKRSPICVYNERRLHTAVPFTIGGVVLMLSPALRGEGIVRKAASFAALCAALCSCNATAPLTASLLGSLPRPAQAGGLALWNTLANIGGYFGPAVFGWLKVATGGNAAGMATMGGVLLLAALIMYTFDEQQAFQKAQEAHDDAEHTAMLPMASERLPHGEPGDSRCEHGCEYGYHPDAGSLATPPHSDLGSHGSVVSHRPASSTVSSSNL